MPLLAAIRRELCPRCRQGRIFRTSLRHGWLNMFDRCPVCDLPFRREQGYFVGAMYLSYLLSIPPVLLLVVLLQRLTAWDWGIAALGAAVAYLPAVPYMTRLARVVWLHFDYAVDPE